MKKALTRHPIWYGLCAYSLLLLLCTLVATPSAAQRQLDLQHSADATQLNAEQWLARMSHAFRELDYDGRFVYLSGTQMSTLRVVHRVKDGVEQERLVHLSGPHNEFVRHGHDIICIHEGNALTRLNHSLAAASLHAIPHSANDNGPDEHHVARLAAHYRFDMHIGQRVADRPAQRIDVLPKDDTRYGYHLWLDQATGLLLKSVLVDHQGTALEVFEFVSLTIGEPIADADLQASDRRSDLTHVHHERPIQSDSQHPRDDAWHPRWLPAGFYMASTDTQPMNGQGQPVDRWVYTDGLSSFTLFIEPLQQTLVAEGVFRRGASVAASERMMRQQQPYLVTVVGEIPAATATKIVRSVHVR